MTSLDWLVIAGYAGIMRAVGLFYSRRNRTSDDYVLGGRRMSPVMVGLSLFATLVSTLSYLSNPGEMIANGPMMGLQVLAHPVIFFIVGFGLIPLLMRQPVTSAYEILEVRLGLGIRRAGAAVFLLLRCGWLATILFATSRVVLIPLLGLDHNPSSEAGQATGAAAIFGGSIPVSVWTAILCVGLGVIAATYTSLGGMRAVVVTDAIQSVTMIVGAILTLIVITNRMGGVTEWWPSKWPAHWEEPGWGFDPTKRAPFGIVMMSTILWYVCTNGSDQMSIQRFLSTRDAAAARRTLAVSQITDVSVSSLLGFTGIALLGFYSVHLLEMPAGKTFKTAGDRLFPMFIVREMPAGLSGLLIAALLSAALSSLSSGLNSACAVLERDFLSRKSATGEVVSSSVARMRKLTWLVTAVAVAVSMLNLLFEGNLLERCFKVINLLTAPLFVLFFLALFVRWANAAGAWVGLFSAIGTAVVVGYGAEFGLPSEWCFSVVWIIPSSLLVGIVTGTVVSAIIRPRMPQGIDSNE